MISLVSPGKRYAYLITLLVVFLYYVGHLFYLQVIKTSEFASRALSISRQTEIIPSQRGEILDRTRDSPLVVNADSFAISIIPADIPNDLKSTVFSKLSTVLDLPAGEIQKRIPTTHYRSYQQIEVAGSVSQEIIYSIAERIDEFPGVRWRSKPRRNYLETGSFSHILGYVGEITRDELKLLYNKGYQAGDTVGKSGIEYQYDELLRGTDGRRFRTVDVSGRNVNNNEEIIPPVMGNNLVLTIDREVQHLAEQALGERIGSAIVMKPATGEILAMVSWPSFDANLLMVKGGNNYLASLLGDTRNPLINRAIQSHYPPASTIKMVMTTAILEENAFNPNERILCNGEVLFGDRIFRCHIRKPGHGRLNLQEALAQSCDVYYWTVGHDKLGIENIITYYRDFGFGQPTGLDLRGEVSGFVPTPQWKERRYNEKWLGGDTFNISIGQGFMLTTPLQVANMLAMIVNDGVVYKPHLLKEVRDPRTDQVQVSVEKEVLWKSSISPETFMTTREHLRSVLVEGTARYPVNTKTVQVAGKTGTAEVGLADRWHSWFVGYAPYDYTNIEDVIIVCVMVEAANAWEWWAPYATNIIMQGYWGKQSYEDALKTLGLSNQKTIQSGRRE